MTVALPSVQAPILIGIGANLPSETYGEPLQACDAALEAIAALDGVRIVAKSRWYESEPVPKSDQPWFINGVVRVETDLSALDLLEALHGIEAAFGRVRTVPNAPRVLDLDLLAYGEQLIDGENGAYVPHPRLDGRAFVLMPLLEVAPGWVHPVTRMSLMDMIAALPPGQICRPLERRKKPR